MPFLTEAPGGITITGTLDTPILTFPTTSVLNSIGPSATIDSYNVQDDTDGPNTVVAGDFLAPVVGGTPNPGVYLGSGELSTLNVSLGALPLLGATVKLDPVAVDYFRGDDGNVYFISDQDLSEGSLTISGTLTVAGITTPLVNADISVLGSLAPNLLNTVALQYTFDPSGQLVLDNGEIDIVCFARGTLIETATGPVAVEDLAVGDMVMTRDEGPQPLRWVGSQSIDAITLQKHPRLTPIRISKGALGDGMPERDLIVSPQHRVLVRSKIAQRVFGTSELLVAAKQLLILDGFELATDLPQVEYFHIMFDRHQVIMSNGAATESLYTGPQALRMVGPAAREELLHLFPQLADAECVTQPARAVPHDKRVRKLAHRHQVHSRALYQ